ncbi:cytochrome ubiquinol oxidase subunit I [Mycobacterium heckeshornense]|uniref:Cytochrome ubiquinol oxidase subunit I n=1 Tax=Mycobacterium heckeshornense TaxID=110505 RepID=A0A2G8B677_9MYCO|nr:cytochrome ubiquinol oxidase subunit I [Mycobacterium heckeshornense]KMV15164.1 cytochrome BD ubiquinol oxidase subunit I [Mycobacterium heckeshornense]MCV7035716.1 cytochrome ubiquinol oxidase subunit I [Mycobacterium heckeshornense]PIJ33212.1 cytochrome ubiquinol oxidase subunit I [Mycobacterium heckeshornense]BCO34945.1 cytochrome ubiquinol oxidase subunit I [Mycobacterium heckeshornense]
MDVVDVSRWQFGITTVYHFIFVPLTIGLAPILAVMQSTWMLTGNTAWYRLTRFFGKLFLINFAIGVATGIVQEFQFGMNWSEYSRFVGDVFGAPLALEGLIAFFFESTFIGLWIFGWGWLARWLHLACIWVVAIAVNISAFFIIAANAFMQHPVGTRFNPRTGRAELTDFGALLTNNTAIWAFLHTVTASLLIAGTFVAGVSAWLIVRTHRHAQGAEQAQTMFRPATIASCWLILVAAVVLLIPTGDMQGKLMFRQQPMKMASAESLCRTETDPSFSILTIGTHNNCESVTRVVTALYVLPFLAEGKFSGVTLQGVNDLQQQYQTRFGPGDYRPNLFVAYWSFRIMIGLLAVPVLFALAALWVTRRGRVPDQQWFGRFGLITVPTPFLAAEAGWVFTEMGRQPWVVVPNPTGDQAVRLTVHAGVSDVPIPTVVTSLVVFTLIYGVLAVVWFWLLRRYVVEGPQEYDAEPAPPQPPAEGEVAPLSFAY